MVSNPERQGKILIDKLLERDYDQGGKFIFISGSQGSGKTSAMLTFLDTVRKRYPEEKIFFSNTFNAPFQFTRLDEWHLMVQEDSGIKIIDRQTHKKADVPITYFDDYEDCYAKAKPGVCNAVFFEVRPMFAPFIHYLRSVNEWCSVFVDELSELAPINPSGKQWHYNKAFSDDIKECRKSQIFIVANSQARNDIDYRILSKVMCEIYLPGATRSRDSKLKKGCIEGLEENPYLGNHAWIEYNSKFGKIHFATIYKPNKKNVFEAVPEVDNPYPDLQRKKRTKPTE